LTFSSRGLNFYPFFFAPFLVNGLSFPGPRRKTACTPHFGSPLLKTLSFAVESGSSIPPPLFSSLPTSFPLVSRSLFFFEIIYFSYPPFFFLPPFSYLLHRVKKMVSSPPLPPGERPLSLPRGILLVPIGPRGADSCGVSCLCLSPKLFPGSLLNSSSYIPSNHASNAKRHPSFFFASVPRSPLRTSPSLQWWGLAALTYHNLRTAIPPLPSDLFPPPFSRGPVKISFFSQSFFPTTPSRRNLHPNW